MQGKKGRMSVVVISWFLLASVCYRTSETVDRITIDYLQLYITTASGCLRTWRTLSASKCVTRIPFGSNMPFMSRIQRDGR